MPSSPEPRFLNSETELRAAIAAPPSRTLQKILPTLDANAQRWVAIAALVALALPRADGSIDVVARAASAGRMRAAIDRAIRIPDEPEVRVGRCAAEFADETRAGALFAVPGIAETLRANGPLRRVGSALELEVAETYLHCAKAFVRSRLWEAPEVHPFEPLVDVESEHADGLGPRARAFVARSPFLALGTALAAATATPRRAATPPASSRSSTKGRCCFRTGRAIGSSTASATSSRTPSLACSSWFRVGRGLCACAQARA